MGSTLDTIFESDVEVFSAADDSRLGWELSEDTRKAIEEIDANIRAAEQMSGQLVAG